MNETETMTPSAEFRFTSTDGVRVACARWDARTSVRGTVQIAHGMGEHIGRYVGLIEALVGAGLTVYGNDHRGHGRTAAQQYVLDHSREIDGLARLASAAPPGENLLNAPFEPARTPFEWLSRDTAVVDAFIDDPLCFAQLQPAAFGSFLGAAPRLCDPASLGKIRRDLPIYLFSGSDDPAGQQLDGVKVLIERYQNAGLNSISHDFYRGARHEMLNEINRDDVRARLVGWISTVLEQRKSRQLGEAEERR